jgi:hypothetical protein
MANWSTDPNHAKTINVFDLGKECVHCHRRCGSFAGGYATICGAAVCHPPASVTDRPDCYLNAISRGHPLRHCEACREVDPAPLPIRPGRVRNKRDGLRLYT